MNQTSIIIAIVALLAIGGGYVVYTGMNSSTELTPQTNERVDVELEGDSEISNSTFRALLAAGRSVKCTFEQAIEDGMQTGTVYLASGRMRGEFTVSGSAQGDYTMHTIKDGDWMYSWGGPMGEKQGIKMQATSEAQGSVAANTNTESKQNIDLDKEMDFSCSAWRADTRVFDIPSDVTFQDFSAVMPGALDINFNANSNLNVNVNTNSSVTPQVNCAVCNQVPEGASRDQCLQALGC